MNGAALWCAFALRAAMRPPLGAARRGLFGILRLRLRYSPRERPGGSCVFALQQAGLGNSVFTQQLSNKFRGALNLVHRAYVQATASDVFPGLGGIAGEVHRAGVDRRQLVGVQAGGADAGRQEVAVHTRKQAAVDDVVELPSTIACL